MYAATPLNISFSTKPKDLKVSVAEGRYGTLYRPVEEAANGSFFAPSEAGEYVYKVEANWGRRGSIIYYFCVRVL